MKYLVLIGVVFSCLANAEIYKWTDPAGQVHYGERPEQGRPAQAVDVEDTQIGSVPIGQPSAKPAPKVIMYATSWCPYCRKARSYFRDKRIAYTEYDIERDRNAKRRYDALGGRGIPVILVGDKRLDGFDVSGFESLYR